eukprot:CAMPEP_0173387998 /NCGR_PEP_ID=MMETSP1356-20130122/10396_1 /TAXON_ID=77927 ORGANISM="Hemiselmis virescens, Strain PCC157" /NCGR_SAMPLE_ID=MMETSP1356 /ASSEMBLY_ACC=CAM_ASM_000847 /LENGTH=79 /DNA_ID=CAMNT_0014344779 /DNA_START=91 /DNA_END=326 /DNA_ORIENTATION=-
MLPCNHFFHSECVSKWLKLRASCPKCRCELKAKKGSGSSGDAEPTTIEGTAPLPLPRIQNANGEWVNAAPMYVPITGFG